MVLKETAIAFIVQGALDATKSCLQIGVDLFRGAKNRLEKIKNSLAEIHKFIVIAERSPIKDPELMKLLEKLKDAAYEGQDLLEEYAIVDRRRSEVAENSMPVRDTTTNKVRKVVTSVLVSPIIMRKKLKELNERLEAIEAEANAFQLKEKVTNLQIEFRKQRETHSFVHKSLVFERDEEKEEIVNWLLSNQAGDNENVSVISIHGIGGIGKTTIAKLVFHKESVQDHFKPKMWSLFRQRAFGNPTEEAVHPNLAPIGRDIVKKCRDIPLAVTTLGGLLCSERSQRKWEFVRDSEMWNLGDENEDGILPALRLSYNHLKPHLKQCFAFCAIFPQDYVMKKELVIKLWMAQGFIPTKRGMELEDNGDEIFDELVMKSFFQDVNAEKNYDYSYYSDSGRIWTTFRMHDLMHDLAHFVMENEYLVVHNGKSKDISPRIRHISSNGLGILAASLPKAQMLRTYVMLETYVMLKKQADFRFPCDVGLFKCLRALDFISQRDNRILRSSCLLPWAISNI
ncbi:hypothetical protein MRB53_009492 [Persea americana]|uniref:Uncharacterized protein n=1 Tax=Persea americana TaxID=3435 RepID=A0ACC2LPI3_PERAE|nr:hypothetical protein MRB53_009492 [Persea americana]